MVCSSVHHQCIKCIILWISNFHSTLSPVFLAEWAWWNESLVWNEILFLVFFGIFAFGIQPVLRSAFVIVITIILFNHVMSSPSYPTPRIALFVRSFVRSSVRPSVRPSVRSSVFPCFRPSPFFSFSVLEVSSSPTEFQWCFKAV